MAKKSEQAVGGMVYLPGTGWIEEGTGWGAPDPYGGATDPAGKITQEEIDLWSTKWSPGMEMTNTPGSGLSLGGGGTGPAYTGPPLGSDADDPQPGGGYPVTPPPGDGTWEGGPPEGWTGGGGGGIPGWDWEVNQPGAPGMEGGGGYDPNDYAFDRYVPGMESPWGVPDVEGGNKDFYRNQFMQLLSEEQGFQNQERDAFDRRSYAQENPLESAPFDWGNMIPDRSTPAVDPVATGPAAGSLPTGYTWLNGSLHFEGNPINNNLVGGGGSGGGHGSGSGGGNYSKA